MGIAAAYQGFSQGTYHYATGWRLQEPQCHHTHNFWLYANVRPCVAYYPFVDTKHPNMDVVIIRENEEDLYTGIEYRQSHAMMESLKLISRSGSEKIVRYAFEYARSHNRKKVTCFMKDNIMKLTDGLFHRVFNEIAMEY